MAQAFFEPDGDGGYVATELTRGPWDPGHQHAGPPAALVGRELERLGEGRIGGPGGPAAQVGRLTYEVLRPVPIGRLTVTGRVERPGRRVEMVSATLSGEEGEALMLARGWRLRTEAAGFERPPGFDTPDEVRHDVIVNLPQASGYSDSKGLFAARKAISEGGSVGSSSRKACGRIEGRRVSKRACSGCR